MVWLAIALFLGLVVGIPCARATRLLIEMMHLGLPQLPPHSAPKTQAVQERLVALERVIIQHATEIRLLEQELRSASAFSSLRRVDLRTRRDFLVDKLIAAKAEFAGLKK